MDSNIETLEIMVIAPNFEAREVTVTAGESVGALAQRLGISGAAEAMDESNNIHGAVKPIGVGDFRPSALSYMTNLAGA
jgi:hypothetical protein